jgi:two-component system cell cycle sensor histidine kinase/response regulator CckA
MPLISVIEDEALIALDIARTLTRSGYSVSGPFSNADSFLNSPDFGKVDLALMDITLKGASSGIQAAMAARERRDCPSIFLTALADKATLEAVKSAEPLGILVKPFSERELLGTVEIGLFRANLEKQLHASEKRYRDLFDTSLSPRCIVSMEGKILESNASFGALFSPSGAKPLFPELFEPVADWDKILEKLEKGSIVVGREATLKSASGARVQALTSFYPFQGGSDSAIMISAEIVDLTESRRLRDELYQAQKMEAMGRLSSGIAHDFNNILTAIVGHAEMLKLDIEPGNPLREDVEGISRTSDRARRLTRQLLGYSRKQSFAPKSISLTSIVKESESLLRKLAGESILFSLYMPGKEKYVFADPVQIEQVLVNLVVNSRDALEGRRDGRIGLVIGEKSLASPLKIRNRTLEKGDYVTLEVSDNGSGISEEIQEKIFEPFFTTKVSGKGTGLGLAIIGSIIDQVGGALGLVSTPGKGSAFTLWFPASTPPGGQDKASRNEIEEDAEGGWADPGSLSGLKILLVDDDESLLGFLTDMLEKAGAAVYPARNAGEALLHREMLDKFILVADIHLPGMSGIELYARISDSGPVPTVLITGKPDEDVQIPAGLVLLEKPFTPRELASAILAQNI